jgi:nucleoside permease NupC
VRSEETTRTPLSWRLGIAAAIFVLGGAAYLARDSIGAIAPDRRHDLARLGLRALFAGFVATRLNAAIAGNLL